MSRQKIVVRGLSTAGLLITLGVAGYFWMVLAIRRCYFPKDPTGDLTAVIIPCLMAALYFATCIWRGRLWRNGTAKDTQETGESRTTP